MAKRNARSSGDLNLSHPAAFDALASPHRLEIISALGDAGRASIAELARRLGRSPNSLYYHIGLLEDAGIVIPAETRRRGRRDEQIWSLASDRILLAASASSPAPGIETSKAIDSMMRLTSRELQNAVLRARDDPGGDRTIIGIRMKGRIDQQTLAKISRHVESIERLLKKANQEDESGRTYAITVVISPTEDKTKKGESK